MFKTLHRREAPSRASRPQTFRLRARAVRACGANRVRDLIEGRRPDIPPKRARLWKKLLSDTGGNAVGRMSVAQCRHLRPV
jgi:hypothetical protein